jgi:hypothetical protein
MAQQDLNNEQLIAAFKAVHTRLVAHDSSLIQLSIMLEWLMTKLSTYKDQEGNPIVIEFDEEFGKFHDEQLARLKDQYNADIAKARASTGANLDE